MKTNTLYFIILLLAATNLNSQTVTTITEGLFHDGLALDTNGNLYGSDYSGDSVFKMDVNRNVSTFVSGLNTPNGIAVNSNNEIYICDHESNRIIKYNDNGDELANYTTTTPAGIKKMPNSDDMLFVGYGNNTINVLTSDGMITQLFSGSPLNGPAGIAFDDSGTIFIGNFNDRRIYKYDNGMLEYVAQLPSGGISANFLGFLTYANGFLYATQLGEHRIYRINPQNIDDFEIFAGSGIGSVDGNVADARFNLPNGILASPDGATLYVSDAGTKNLRIISDVTLSINEFIDADFSLMLYPNPSSEILTIKGVLLEQSSFDIAVYDTLGQRIFSESNPFETEAFERNINTSDWSSGIYTVLITSDKYRTSKKVVR
ncbi:T9SS type A sorting domain-containing protein [Aquimarina litoralis]|uniref:T9SS type A sorting domain-containing protein n=1 Tax=Aquimarina litoralis TaxID=584605 RepID=UPI001C59EECE|nr:T9SS type A sorting domain-containing protein [Aquimarina litoralis]MBW1298530.1 T9SS type A sorting domain-containing protein [Aquimarina litoralis]